MLQTDEAQSSLFIKQLLLFEHSIAVVSWTKTAKITKIILSNILQDQFYQLSERCELLVFQVSTDDSPSDPQPELSEVKYVFSHN